MTKDASRGEHALTLIEIDVLIAVHNAESTIVEAVESALQQTIVSTQQLDSPEKTTVDRHQHRQHFNIHVCCYDDGSTDNSWNLLKDLKTKFGNHQQRPSVLSKPPHQNFRTYLHIAKPEDGVSRGAGYARNRAAELHSSETSLDDGNDDCSNSDNKTVHRFIAILDSDDIMHPHRLYCQSRALLALGKPLRHRTLLGCTFEREPRGSTWHYTNWANSLSDERLMLERFREITVIQPTWMICRERFTELGGYIEAPKLNNDGSINQNPFSNAGAQAEITASGGGLSLIHPQFDTAATLRVAEDLRFFHAHLFKDGLLKLLRHGTPLLTYRHSGGSQSSRTPRKLLLQLRVLAWERTILFGNRNESDSYNKQSSVWTSGFAIWGAGRDGKDFFKALSPPAQRLVKCMVDVDEKKISSGWYVHRELQSKIPIVHFSELAKTDERRKELREDSGVFGQIVKGGHGNVTGKSMSTGGRESAPMPPTKRRKTSKHHFEDQVSLFASLPVVVCVSMYRTNGALEQNVKQIDRTEGVDLWHIS